MKKIKTLSEITSTIQRKEDFYQEIGGKIYNLSFIMLLNMKLIDIISMINDGVLYCNIEN